MAVVLFAVGVVLGVAVPHYIIRYDERRLTPAQQARGWGTATHWGAVVVFSYFCLPVHFAKTRRSAWGLQLGLLWTSGALGVHGMLLSLLEAWSD